MTAAVIGAAWGVLVVLGAWTRRPTAPRLPDPDQAEGRRSRRQRLRPSIAAQSLGSLLTGVLGRPPDPVQDRMLGWATLAGLVALVLGPWWWAPLGSAAVVGVHRFRVRQARRRDQDRVADELPDVVDLFVLAAGAGMNVALSVEAVSRFADGAVGAALVEVDRVRLQGGRLADALERLPDVLGEAVRSLAVALAGAERYGTPLVPALESLAAEVRLARRRRAEDVARQAPVKLIFPLVLCALPAFALLTVVPLLLATLRSLHA